MQQLIALMASVLLFSSCLDKSENNNLVVYRIAEEGLQGSNKTISIATDAVYHGFEAKLKDPAMKELAGYWQPRAMIIKSISDSMVKYINGLKEELKNEAGGNDPKNKDWENAMGVSEHLFESHGRGKELLAALIKYREQMFATDPGMKNQFEHTAKFFSGEFTFTATDTVPFTKTFFSNIPVIAANVMLSKFVNNVKICENEFVIYCYNRVGSLDGASMYEKFEVIIGQNSSYMKVGDELEISAGVGSFSTASQPKFTIDGKLIACDEHGIVIYKSKTPLKAGKYSKAVKIEYTSPDGTPRSTTKNIEYTVVESN